VSAPTAQSTAIGQLVGGIVGRGRINMSNCTVGDVVISTDCADSLYAGGICGANDQAVVENSTSSAVIKEFVNSGSKEVYLGGITGLNGAPQDTYEEEDNVSAVRGCTFSGELYGGRNTNCNCRIGFIAGESTAPCEVSDCIVKNAKMEIGQSGKSVYAGGIVGRNLGGNIARCANYQDIEILSDSGGIYFGGIAGSNTIGSFTKIETNSENEQTEETVYTYGGKITDCYNEGNLKVTSSGLTEFGGLVGYHTGQGVCDNGQPRVERCYTKGDVTAILNKQTTVLIGGACGYIVDGEVTNTYSESNVDVTFDGYTPTSGTTFVSGFSRIMHADDKNQGNEYPNSIVQNCYSSGSVTISENAVGIIGTGPFASDLRTNLIDGRDEIPVVRGNYYLSENPDEELEKDKEIATPLTAEQFAEQNSFVVKAVDESEADTQWDFEDVWYMSEGRPHLIYEKPAIYQLEYTEENNQKVSIDKIILSKPHSGSKLYLAAYDGAALKSSTIKTVDITDELCTNDEFLVIELDEPYEIPVLSTDVRLYVWDNNMIPITEVKTVN
jgi:hypothetical protein